MAAICMCICRWRTGLDAHGGRRCQRPRWSGTAAARASAPSRGAPAAGWPPPPAAPGPAPAFLPHPTCKYHVRAGNRSAIGNTMAALSQYYALPTTIRCPVCGVVCSLTTEFDTLVCRYNALQEGVTDTSPGTFFGKAHPRCECAQRAPSASAPSHSRVPRAPPHDTAPGDPAANWHTC